MVTCEWVCPCVTQVPPQELSEFSDWLSESVSADHPYLLKLEAVDVHPCLTFRNKEVGVVRQ